ncbi:hypothetical protein ABFS83_05G027400 [Erythranthe nasuta]
MKKVQFLLVLLSFLMASLSGPIMVKAEALQLPNCVENRDCLPLCGSHCKFCGCFGGVCFRGCDAPPKPFFLSNAAAHRTKD